MLLASHLHSHAAPFMETVGGPGHTVVEAMAEGPLEVRFDMSWLGRKRRVRGAPGPAGQAQQAVSEMLDPYHQRASVSDGDRMLIEPGKVLANIALAMEAPGATVTVVDQTLGDERRRRSHRSPRCRSRQRRQGLRSP